MKKKAIYLQYIGCLIYQYKKLFSTFLVSSSNGTDFNVAESALGI